MPGPRCASTLVYVPNNRRADDFLRVGWTRRSHDLQGCRGSVRPSVARIAGAPINDLESELMAAVIPFLPANKKGWHAAAW